MEIDPETMGCSFCGHGRSEERKLIAGPSVFICDRCVTRAARVVAGEEAPSTMMVKVAPGPESEPAVVCKFCGLSCGEVKVLVGSVEPELQMHICDECVAFCRDMLAETAAQA